LTPERELLPAAATKSAIPTIPTTTPTEIKAYLVVFEAPAVATLENEDDWLVNVRYFNRSSEPKDDLAETTLDEMRPADSPTVLRDRPIGPISDAMDVLVVAIRSATAIASVVMFFIFVGMELQLLSFVAGRKTG
jgi:hypothetical protein